MRRRTALLALGGALATLAGCVERGDDPNSNGDDSRASGTSSTRGPEWAADPDGETIDDQFGDNLDRPECDVDAETVEVGGDGMRETAETIPYPDATTYDDATTYVEDFEEAYVTHDALCDRSDYILGIGYTVSEREVREADDGTDIVYLLRYGGATSGVSEPGKPPWAVELAPMPIGYAVDQTGMARLELDDADRFHNEEPPEVTPDPRDEGSLVERFE